MDERTKLLVPGETSPEIRAFAWSGFIHLAFWSFCFELLPTTTVQQVISGDLETGKWASIFFIMNNVIHSIVKTLYPSILLTLVVLIFALQFEESPILTVQAITPLLWGISMITCLLIWLVFGTYALAFLSIKPRLCFPTLFIVLSGFIWGLQYYLRGVGYLAIVLNASKSRSNFSAGMALSFFLILVIYPRFS